jgi:hypothetical protein
MREQFRIVRRALDASGHPWRCIPGGKHPRVIVEAHGAVIAVPIAFSPRDRHTAGLNTLKQINRAVNEAKVRATVDTV